MAKGKNFTFYEHDPASAESVARSLRSAGMKDVKVTKEISLMTRHFTGRYAISHFDPNFDNRHSSENRIKHSRKRR